MRLAHRARTPITSGTIRRGVRQSPLVAVAEMLNERELGRYVQRVDGRWPLERVLLGGAKVLDAQGAPPQRERGPELVVVLIPEFFAGGPLLERVLQGAHLGDPAEMQGL